MTSADEIKVALYRVIHETTEQCDTGRDFSRKSALSRETIIRLLIGAKGGTLDKVLHTADITVTAALK